MVYGVGLAQIVGLADRAPGPHRPWATLSTCNQSSVPTAVALVVVPCSRQPLRCKIAILSPSLRWLSRSSVAPNVHTREPIGRSVRVTLAASTLEALSRISTSTITTVLLKKGLRNVWIRGARPLRTPGPRLVGRAFTMRFIPAREDLATPESWGSARSTRAAIEAMPEGCVVVVDASGVIDAGGFGDILSARMRRRGVCALVTDGAVRDIAGVVATGLPVWCRGAAAPPSIARLHFVGWQEPIGCGGVAVFPDDVVVVDDDGATIVPAALAEEVAGSGAEQEELEAWIMTEVERGVPLPGLYPANSQTRARYDAFKKQKG